MKRTCLLLTALLLITVTGVWAQSPANLRLYGPETPMNRIISDYFNTEGAVVVAVAQDTTRTEDVITNFVIANLGNADPLAVHRMRVNGMNWADIMNQLNINPQVLFVPVTETVDQLPGVYQRPYRMLRETRAGTRNVIVLYDDDVRRLANTWFLVNRFNYSPIEVMRQYSRGVSYIDLIGRRTDLSGRARF